MKIEERAAAGGGVGVGGKTLECTPSSFGKQINTINFKFTSISKMINETK